MSFEGHLLHHSMAPVAPTPLIMRQANLAAPKMAPSLQHMQARTALATGTTREAPRITASSASETPLSTALASQTSAAKRQVLCCVFNALPLPPAPDPTSLSSMTCLVSIALAAGGAAGAAEWGLTIQGTPGDGFCHEGAHS